MSYYVQIPRINGRKGHADLGTWLNTTGIGEVEYHEGGWSDGHINSIAPHLKFEREEDALAYVLTKGGNFSREIPEKLPRNAVESR